MVHLARRFLLTAATLLLAATGVDAQSAGEGKQDGAALTNADEAARQSSNPLGGDFIIVLNQFDNYFMQGNVTRSSRKINSWSFQPVVPLPMEDLIGDHWIMVNRPTLPIVMRADLPDGGNLTGGGPPSIPPNPGRRSFPFEEERGLGDLVMFNLIGQSIPTDAAGGGDLVWGIGPTWQFPTATDSQLGSGKYQVGPAAVGSFIGKEFILGGLFQHWESYADGGRGPNRSTSFSWLNVFYFYNLPGGWQVGGTPVVTSDWEASGDDRWTVPVGLGVYKTSLIGGKMPMKIGMEMQYMPITPDTYGQEFNIRFVVAPILPSPFGNFQPPGS